MPGCILRPATSRRLKSGSAWHASLHDSVAQTFYSIALAAHAAKARFRGDPDPDNHRQVVEQRLNHILDLADAGLTEMKALIFDLQSEGIRRDGLVQRCSGTSPRSPHATTCASKRNWAAEPDASLETKEAIYGIRA